MLCYQPTKKRLENAPSSSEAAQMTNSLVDLRCSDPHVGKNIHRGGHFAVQGLMTTIPTPSKSRARYRRHAARTGESCDLAVRRQDRASGGPARSGAVEPGYPVVEILAQYLLDRPRKRIPATALKQDRYVVAQLRFADGGEIQVCRRAVPNPPLHRWIRRQAQEIGHGVGIE